MKYLISALVVLAALSSAHALTVGAGGQVTNWGITPFSNWGPPANVISNGGQDNNWSPINYPSGVGHQPSPGGATGELFDLEALYARQNGDNFEALLITSMPLYTTLSAGGYHYRLGDLFIDMDNDDTYDMVLITQDTNGQGFVGGELRKVSEVYGIIGHDSGYGGYPDIAEQANPFSLKSGSLLATGTLSSAFYNYSNGTEPTWIYEWSVPFGDLSLTQGETLKLHMTVECGNDLIEVSGTPLGQPNVPEPMTLVLAGSALAALARRARRWSKR